MYKNNSYRPSPRRKKPNYKKRFYFMCGIALFLCLLLFVGLYRNYNYIVFKHLISGHYIYTETLDGLYQNAIDKTPENNYFKNFDEVVISIVTEKIRETAGDRYTYLYTPVQFENEKAYTKENAEQSEIIVLSDDTVYLRLTNISNYTRKLIYDSRTLLNGYSNIVIDLRGNNGGSVSELYKISDLFLDHQAIIGSEIARHEIFSTVAKARRERYFDFENIFLLQDSRTASAAEGFIVALRENLENVQIVGTQSFGKGIGQITLPIKSGFAVKATFIKILTPQNNSIHEEGITPDILCEDEDALEHVKKLLQID